MILLIFIASVVVAIAFRRQERRHRIALVWEYERRGIPVPRVEPKLKRTEAVLNVCLGMLILCFGCAVVVMHIRMTALLGEIPGSPGHFPDSGIWEQAAAYCAGGIALIILGLRALRHIHRFERPASPDG
jgi:hypothetical protein